MSESKLGPDSTIMEVFNEIMPEEGGMRVVPVTVPHEGGAALGILLAGDPDTANVAMANLMNYIMEMHQVAEQHAASEKILGTDGEPIEDEPRIVVP